VILPKDPTGPRLRPVNDIPPVFLFRTCFLSPFGHVCPVGPSLSRAPLPHRLLILMAEPGFFPSDRLKFFRRIPSCRSFKLFQFTGPPPMLSFFDRAAELPLFLLWRKSRLDVSQHLVKVSFPLEKTFFSLNGRSSRPIYSQGEFPSNPRFFSLSFGMETLARENLSPPSRS